MRRVREKLPRWRYQRQVKKVFGETANLIAQDRRRRNMLAAA